MDAALPMPSVRVHAPAKINLFLAVTGRRPDGFHDLLSLAAPLAWGDHLDADWAPARASGDTLAVTGLEAPAGPDNLVLRAARAYRQKRPHTPPVAFTLHKRIPLQAGLGGGSSDAVATLRALEILSGDPLPPPDILALAASLGSDCPLFLSSGPVILRGRGEKIEPVPPNAVPRLQGRRILVFRPGFGIDTAWAYRRLAEDPCAFLPAHQAESRLDRWLHGTDPLEALLFNSFETALFPRYPAYPCLFQSWPDPAPGLRRALLSGSGSACFLLLQPEENAAPGGDLHRLIQDAWGDRAFSIESRLGPF